MNKEETEVGEYCNKCSRMFSIGLIRIVTSKLSEKDKVKYLMKLYKVIDEVTEL